MSEQKQVTDWEIRVRQVTAWQASFAPQGPGEPGLYTFQLVLDEGAEEQVLSLTEDDADNLFDWLSASSNVWYDQARQVLMFGTRSVGS